MDKARIALVPTYPIMPHDSILQQIPSHLLNAHFVSTPHASSLYCRLCVKKLFFSVAQLMCETDEVSLQITLRVTHWLRWRWPPASWALPCSGPRRCRCLNLPPLWDWRPDPGLLGTLCPLWAPAVLLSPTTPRAQVCRVGDDRPPAAGCPLWRPATSWAPCRLSLQWRTGENLNNEIDFQLHEGPDNHQSSKPLKH